jgi:ubiquinone/menaquinone biosynthesis C-methylase UbiE
MSQEELFVSLEGDRWFERNRPALLNVDFEHDVPTMLFEMYHLRPRAVLEIGAANGYRLAAIHQRFGCRVVGIEPAQAAISDGRERFPHVELYPGRADEIPLDAEFDVVILNFVLHWVGRDRLLRAVAEIDRVTADGGFVIIGDFLPTGLRRRPYHHLPVGAVYTYKQDYAATFMASGGYEAVALLTGNHASKELTADVDDDDRIGTWLLRKRLTTLYRDDSVPSPSTTDAGR